MSKISGNGATKFYATYLGGASDDSGLGIAVDSSGNAYVTGQTQSTNFPLMNPLSASLQFIDAFVTKLNAGGVLLYSTYLGGTGVEQGTGIAVDNIGNAYVTGSTNSATDFPHTLGAFQTSNHSTLGSDNGFVTKLNTTLIGAASLIYSTYLGGALADQALAIAIDGSSAGCTGVGAACACVTGSATSGPGAPGSLNFPVTPGSFQPVKPSAAATDSAFVTKFNPTGTGLVFSTYLGGSGSDVGHGIAVDTTGNTYVTGGTGSTNFPTTLNPIQLHTGGGLSDAFVTKLNPAGTAPLVYSTYLGGLLIDVGNGIAVDSSGTAYVVGSTTSLNFPTSNALFPTGSVFVAALNPAGNSFAYSTYLSGNPSDEGLGIAATPTGNAYVTGSTISPSFPVVSAIQPTPGGGGDAFVTVISPAADVSPTAVSVTPAAGSGASGAFQFVASSASGFGDIAAMEAIINGVFSGAQACYVRYERADRKSVV